MRRLSALLVFSAFLAVGCVKPPPLEADGLIVTGLYVTDPVQRSLVARGGREPLSWTLTSGALPPGVTLARSGALGGAATAAGSFTGSVRVEDSSGQLQSVEVAFSVTALPALAGVQPPATTGSLFWMSLDPTGGVAPLQLRVASGELPPGVALGTKGLSGTPSTPGVYSFAIEVTDAKGRAVARQFSLPVRAPLSVASSVLPDGYDGSTYAGSLLAAGGAAPFTWSALGALPAGIVLQADGQLSGTCSGVGTANFEVKVVDAEGRSATRVVSLGRYAQLAFVTSALAGASVGADYTESIEASGGKGALLYSAASPPAGLTLAADGTFSGKPSAEGSFTFAVRVTDQNGKTLTRDYTLSVTTGLAVSTSTLPEGYQGLAYSQTLAATGGTGSYTWTAIGAPPSGLTVASDGRVSGTPSVNGTFSFEVEAKDAANRTARRSVSLVLYGPVQITTTTLPNATVGTSYSRTIAASGGKGTLSLTTGSPPPGLTLATGGVLSGTPSTAGSFQFTVTATDANGKTGARQLTLQVNPEGPTAILKVASWNIEWFGDPSRGPTNDVTQRANATRVIAEAGYHLWGLAELVDAVEFGELLTGLGSNWSGFMANEAFVTSGSSYYTSAEQKVGIVYDERVITVHSARVLFTTSSTCVNAFAGRPPMEVSLTANVEGSIVSGRLIVLHAKAHLSPYDTSYERRKEGSACLKAYLDGTPNDAVFVVGDYNDDLDRSIVTTAQHPACTPSSNASYCVTPYLDLVSDSADYEFTTMSFSINGTSTTQYPDPIDHHLVTDELAAMYVADSAEVLRPDQWTTPVADFINSTSDHYPAGTGYLIGGAPPPPPGSPKVFMNEIRAREVTALDYSTEFVEVMNGGTVAADISGWTIRDDFGVRYTFASGSTLQPGKVIVASNPGGLSFHPTDSARLHDAAGNQVELFSWVNDNGLPAGVSFNRATDGDSTASFVDHRTLAGFTASPGTRADGTAF